MGKTSTVINQKKRIRYAIPKYKKVYAVYQYDRKQFARIYKKLRALAITLNDASIYERVNPYRVLSLCYIRDERGNLCHTGDEKHIYRYKALSSIQIALGQYLTKYLGLAPNSFHYLYKRTGLRIYIDEDDETQAELLKASQCPLRLRIEIHIKLLKWLRAGLELEDVTTLINQKYSKEMEIYWHETFKTLETIR